MDRMDRMDHHTNHESTENNTRTSRMDAGEPVDISNFGTTYTNSVYTAQIQHDGGDLVVNATGGKILLDGAGGIDLGASGTNTTVKGDFFVEGTFNLAQMSSDTLDGETLNISGDSSFGGAVDIAGPLTVNGPLKMGGSFSPSGNVEVESESSLNSTASTRYLVFGDQSEGSWRIGVADNNRLTFQRNDGTTWVTLGQLGQKN